MCRKFYTSLLLFNLKTIGAMIAPLSIAPGINTAIVTADYNARPEYVYRQIITIKMQLITIGTKPCAIPQARPATIQARKCR